MYLPRVGSYRCQPVPTTSRVDDKFHRLVTVEDAQVADGESQLGSLAAPLEHPQLAQGQSSGITR